MEKGSASNDPQDHKEYQEADFNQEIIPAKNNEWWFSEEAERRITECLKHPEKATEFFNWAKRPFQPLPRGDGYDTAVPEIESRASGGSEFTIGIDQELAGQAVDALSYALELFFDAGETLNPGAPNYQYAQSLIALKREICQKSLKQD